MISPLNEAGYYSFDAVPEGLFRITLHAPGYRRQSLPLYIAPGTVRLDFFTQESTDDDVLSGVVMASADSVPVAKVHVELLSDEVVVGHTYTCATGVFEAPLTGTAVEGSVMARFSAPGFETQVVNLQLPVSGPISIYLEELTAPGKECDAFGCGTRTGPGEAGWPFDAVITGLFCLWAVSRRKRASLISSRRCSQNQG